MKRLLSLIFPIFLLAMLCGCKETGIGSKNLLRAIYFEKEENQYEARLICFQSAPSADAGEAHESALVLEGSGDTVFNALRSASREQGGELFYGQSELLLIGPNLSKENPFDVINFIAQQQGGRPNTGIYLVDLELDELKKCDQLDHLIDSIEVLREQGTYQVPLYQLQQQKGALLPVLHLDEKTQSAISAGAELYKNEHRVSHLTLAQTQLCSLLSGQSHKAKFTKDGQNPIHFTSDSVSVGYQVLPDKNGPVLHITLQGHIRQLQTSKGAENSCSASCTKQLNTWLEEQAQWIIEHTFAEGNDVFQFEHRLESYHAKTIEDLKRSESFFTAERIQFSSNLTTL